MQTNAWFEVLYELNKSSIYPHISRFKIYDWLSYLKEKKTTVMLCESNELLKPGPGRLKILSDPHYSTYMQMVV